ncbi:hypothetical protein FRB95_011724 [Tulasnella sp. JGI-2019a]|nr:hypothetical protein FRB95_011724 [Tulasnella sp. JGI-2019a]
MPSSLYTTSLYTISGDEDVYGELEDQHDRESLSRSPSHPVSASSDVKFLSRYPSTHPPDTPTLNPSQRPAVSEDRSHSTAAKRSRQQLAVGGIKGHTGQTNLLNVRGRSRSGHSRDAEPQKMNRTTSRKSVAPSRLEPTAPPNFSPSTSNISPAPPVIIVSEPTQPLARGLKFLKSALGMSSRVPNTGSSTPSGISATSDVASWVSTIQKLAPLPPSTFDLVQKHKIEPQGLGNPSARRLAIYVPSNPSSYSDGTASNTSLVIPYDDSELDESPAPRSARVVANADPSSKSEQSLLPPNPRPRGKPDIVVDRQRGRRAPARPPRVPPPLYDKALPPPPSSPIWTDGESHSDSSFPILLRRDSSTLTVNSSIGPDAISSSSQRSGSSDAARSLARSNSNISSSSSNHVSPNAHADKSREFVYHLPLDSDQLSEGGKQPFQITRHMLDGEQQEKTVVVDVRPGCRPGTRITFPGAGNERIPGTYEDVVFVVEQIPDEGSAHPDIGSLVVTEETTLAGALDSEAVVIPTGIDTPGGEEDSQSMVNGLEPINQSPDSSMDTPTLHHAEPLEGSAADYQQTQLQSFAQVQVAEQQLQQEEVNPLNMALASLGRHHIPLEHLEIDESSVIGRGGFGIVMRGKMLGYHSDVAVKRLKSDETRDIRVAKRLVREMKAWSKLEHRNILSLIGCHLSEARDLALIVCPLQSNGNVRDYLQRVKPNALERLELALDTLSAIEYLHNLDPPVVHGDIKSVNVLVGDERQALLCDFGLTLAADEVPTGLTTSKGFKGSVRYCSPEVVMHEEARRTVFSDMWAWGCLLVEIMKETIPYAQLRNDFQVMFALTNRVPPESEELLIDPVDIRSIVQGCWHVEPGLRSTAETSAKDLRIIMASLDTVTETISDAGVLGEE